MKARWFYALLAVASLTGILVAGFVAHSEASAAMSAGVQHDAGAPTTSVPF